MPKRTGRPWQRKKARVIRRDGGICHLCYQPGADTADHLVLHRDGGPDTMANLKAAHVECNKIRGTRSVDVARADIATRHNLTTTGPDGGHTW